MAYDPTIFNVDPYYDDYDDNKKFLRVLYKPGYAVQARELTQSQTILQKQIQRFGDHVFKDGSIVSESQLFVNDTQFLRVTSLTGYGGVSISDFDGLTAQVSGKNTIRILDVLSGLSGSNKDTQSLIFFKDYIAGSTAFAVGDSLVATYNGTQISCTITGGTSQNDYSGAPNVLPYAGNSTFVGIDAGIRYIKGYFVNHDQQKLTPYNVTGSSTANSYRVFNNLNSVVKFDVANTIVTATDDDSLNDPAYGSYNYAAPGADRYRLDLTLNHGPYSVTADYSLVTIKDGDVNFKSNDPEYNVLAKTMARRTYDESGNYTLNDFPISVEDTTDESILKIKIGSGKAYVYGYEFVNNGVLALTADKARSIRSISDTDMQQIPFVIGNSSIVSLNSSLTSQVFDKVDWNGSPLFYMSAGTSGAFSQVGTVRLGKYDAIDSPTKIHLYDIILNSGFTAGSAQRLFYPGYTASNQHLFNFSGNALNVSDTSYNSLLFPLSNDVSSYAVREINNHTIKIQRSTTFNLSAGVTATISMSDFDAANEFASGNFADFNSINDIVAFSATGAALSLSKILVDAQTLKVSYPSSVSNGTIFANIAVSPNASVLFARTKNSVTETASVIMTQNNYEKFAYINGKVDIYDIISITGNTGGSNFSMTDHFYLDDGQRDDIYDWSRIVLKNQYYSAGVTGISITYRRYDHPANSAPYLISSYGNPAALGLGTGGTGAAYKSIPLYTYKNSLGKTVNLAGCLDARPDRVTPSSFGATSNPQNYSATGGTKLMGTSFEMAWDYYQPRTDKIVLTPDKQFKIITGVATDDQSPPPNDQDNAMTLATITFNPYTRNASDTTKFITKNRRYTMRDIGTLEKRIDRIEYYTTLSLQEQDAKNLEIQDANGLNKFKNGIFVDNFASRTNSDYTNKNISCSVDQLRQETRPKFLTKYVDFALTGSVPSGLTYASNGLALCNYTTETFVMQKFASKSVNVNPFDVTNFNGSLIMTPETDDWIDTQTNPDVLVNLDGQHDGIGDLQEVDFGTIWNNWETTWTGEPVATSPWKPKATLETLTSPYGNGLGTPVGGLGPFYGNAGLQRDYIPLAQTVLTRSVSRDSIEKRIGIRNTITPETVTRNIGNRVVNVGIVPYMRAASIAIKANDMRPSVRVYPFFDNVDVSQYFAVNGVTGAAIVTDSSGRLGYNNTITFSIPSGTFKTGERLLRLLDDPNNIVANCTTSAERIYRAQGLIKTEESTVVSTRNLHIRREAVNEERVIKTTGTETRPYELKTKANAGSYTIVDNRRVCWTDPVAQTFLIDPLQYPSGLYLKKIEIFFKTKAANLPVTLQLRPTVNGYPSSYEIVPFSEVSLLPASVNTSTDGTTATEFVFENPVYLQSGEYSMVLISNSNEYEVWVSEVGQDDAATGERIASQPYTGSFFKSQNSSTWNAEQALDLKFTLHKCIFDTTGGSLQFVFNETDFDTGYPNINNGANLFRLNTTYITPASTTVDSTINFEVDGVNVPAPNNENIIFNIKKSIKDSSENTITATITLNTTNEDVTPALDLQRVSGLYVQNLLNNFAGSMSTQQSYEESPSILPLTAGSVSATRYISRKINLQDGFESNDVDVYLSARLPAGSALKVYLKSQAKTDSSRFESLPYELMQIHPTYSNYYEPSQYLSVGEDDYVDLRFVRGGTGVMRTSGITGDSEFSKFQVKVVLYGDYTNSVVPAFKDFKAIAT
jgi:Domain of unknown function (DUF4815)